MVEGKNVRPDMQTACCKDDAYVARWEKESGSRNVAAK